MIIERIRTSIINGYYKDTQEFILQALNEHIAIDKIFHEGMFPAMRQIEQLYKENVVSIPNILASARCMQKGMELLSPYMNTSNYQPLAKVILGTVEGDLHDLGKNLVGIIFRANGFEVIDLGVDVSEKQFLSAIRENPDASIVCISSLLTITMKEMKQIVKAIRRYDTKGRLKILVGGGPVTQNFADEIGADGYTENAIDAANLARSFFIQDE